MRNLILFLTLLFSSVSFAQTLNDIVNFDSLNVNLINDELINRIIKERKSKNATNILKDTIPMFAAKLKTLYYEKYGDIVHEKLNWDSPKSNTITYDLYGRGYLVDIECPTKEGRLSMAQHAMQSYKYKYETEISKSYETDKLSNITYQKLIDGIFDDVISSSSDYNLIFDFSDKEKYLGVSSGLYTTNTNEIILIITYVLAVNY